ncbi:MAG: hypothetical protein FNP40_10825 [Dehalobacter sp. 4CP]|uniref:hypothetical protein n=1 Tax=Dehalobacter sp. CP TaxID=2594474 RepID=UPI0013C8D4D5|nr:hypothetical protein [Dehalobacter sp.]NBJ16031.1 hypothetical protein [Dehalobacter sp. 4CP]
MSNTNYICFDRYLEEYDYFKLKKYADNSGTRLSLKELNEGWFIDEETNQPLRVYEVEFLDDEGFSFSLVLQFRDDILRVVTIYDMDDYVKPIKEDCYPDITTDMYKEDDKLFETLSKQLGINA